MKSFSELPLSPALRKNLSRLGFVEPTPVQALAIEPALAGCDVVATAQTGTGKTLAFVLPLIQTISQITSLLSGPTPSAGRGAAGREAAPPAGLGAPAAGLRAVVLTPTRELAMQIDETFIQMASGTGVRASVAVGGLSERAQLQSIRNGSQVLIATPGRLFDFMGRKLIDLRNVRMLVLDEADRMLDMGFLPTVQKIIAATPSNRQTLLFSATIQSSVKHLIHTHVRNAVRIEVGDTSKPIDKIELHVYEVEQDRKLGLLQQMLDREEGSFLVFARTKHGADKLAKKLSREGSKTAVIHGNRSQSQRTQALRGFQDGQYRVLVATDVASRGIHVEGIAHVVNYDLPQVPEDFIHRVGRTGRAGAAGTASTFATRSERSQVLQIERTLDAKLMRRPVSSDVPAEKHSAPVLVIPSSRPSVGSRPKARVRSFGPRGRGSRRRAV
ncbi:MAG: DEAD/DEAH box helicase [Bryobacterales bacterium]|nr:DEAD/DEAH box helicase [Bryobacterales bacterium]